jgi:hypothetical protein
MANKWEFTIQTKAPVSKAIDYYMHPENLSKLHSEFVKQVTIKSTEGDTITFEQQMEMMKRRIVSLNKLHRQDNTITVDTIEGDGKGSKVTMAIREIPGGSEVKYTAEMELGPLGFFAKGPAKSAMEKVVGEDKTNLDSA